jgi:hypothetical protein
MASRLTVVTGPAGVDIGPATAAIGAGVGDGLAVRVIDDYWGGTPHTSPDPFHFVGEKPGAVRLRHLPSAWQNPDTNLGVVFTQGPMSFTDDLHTMDALGLDPSHRLTVQSLTHPLNRAFTYPLPIEPGDVGVHARDAVLRAGGHVLIEAGSGMSHLDAITALRLPPWAPWIGRIDLWTVFDVHRMIERSAPGERIDAERIGVTVAGELTALGGSVSASAVPLRSQVVILGLEALPDLDPGTVVDEVYIRTEGGVDAISLGLQGVSTGA